MEDFASGSADGDGAVSGNGYGDQLMLVREERVRPEDDIRLVEAVRDRPVLWDHKLAFDCKDDREKAWIDVLLSVQGPMFPDGKV